MANNINFITGETYTLSELFSGDRRIIIPDLQRDYCWADEVHTDAKIELVSNFMDNLIKQFDPEDSIDQLNLGLIYGYEEPKNHIQLCDGQQRLTTLYLLIGMLNRSLGDDCLKKYLISDFEYNDDKEPYLQYSIRESSLYFLSDLVCKFFINGRGLPNVDSIVKKENPWFFAEYNQDPSIKSMISALKIIEKKLETKDKKWLLDFSNFLLKQLTFMYYNMGNRRNGEETFVVINTTGEPLSATQNLKPLVLNAEINKDVFEVSFKQWEEIETWFWKNRIVNNGNETADAGFNEFLRWVTIIELAKNNDSDKINQIFKSGGYSFPVETIKFTSLYSYWKSAKFIFEAIPQYFTKDHISPKTPLTQIDCFKLCPVILYCQKWEVSVDDSLSIRRVYEFFNNLSRYLNINVELSSVYNAIKAVDLMPNKDIISLIDCDNVSKHIRTDEELLKLNILKDNPKRVDIEKEFWYTQNYGNNEPKSHAIWNGEIKTLIEWSTASNLFDLDIFIRYRDLFDRVFIENCVNIDLTRRAFLTLGLKGYPRVFSGNTNWSFGWNYSDWKIIIDENSDKIKLFFDTLLVSDNIEEKQEKMISDFIDRSFWWSIFVENGNYLSYCKEKKAQLINQGIIRLLEKSRSSTNNKYLYGCQEVKNNSTDWTPWRAYESKCLYTDHNKFNIAIDLCVATGNSREEMFYLKIFNRGNSTKEHFDLSLIKAEYGLVDDIGCFKSSNTSADKCYEFCEKLMSMIFQ